MSLKLPKPKKQQDGLDQQLVRLRRNRQIFKRVFTIIPSENLMQDSSVGQYDVSSTKFESFVVANNCLFNCKKSGGKKFLLFTKRVKRATYTVCIPRDMDDNIVINTVFKILLGCDPTFMRDVLVVFDKSIGQLVEYALVEMHKKNSKIFRRICCKNLYSLKCELYD